MVLRQWGFYIKSFEVGKYIYGSPRYYERNGAAHIEKIFSSLPNQGKQEAIQSLYSGRICGSEGTN